MSTLENVKQHLTDLACAGAAKAKKLSAAARIKADSMAQQDTIRKSYLELGKLWYSRNGTQPKEPYAALCTRIARAQAAIRANREKLKRLEEDDV